MTRPLERPRARIERDIGSLEAEQIVLLVWRRHELVIDERRGFMRWRHLPARRKGQKPPPPCRQFWDCSGRAPVVIRNTRSGSDLGWPTHFVQAHKIERSAPEILASLEEPPAPMSGLHGIVERRAIRAWQVDWALPDRERDYLRVKCYGLITAPGPGDYPPEQIQRDMPTPREISEYVETMGWIARLDKEHQRVIWLRARGLTFRSIAERTKSNEQSARRLFEAAIRSLSRIAAQKGNIGREAA